MIKTLQKTYFRTLLLPLLWLIPLNNGYLQIANFVFPILLLLDVLSFKKSKYFYIDQFDIALLLLLIVGFVSTIVNNSFTVQYTNLLIVACQCLWSIVFKSAARTEQIPRDDIVGFIKKTVLILTIYLLLAFVLWSVGNIHAYRYSNAFLHKIIGPFYNTAIFSEFLLPFVPILLCSIPYFRFDTKYKKYIIALTVLIGAVFLFNGIRTCILAFFVSVVLILGRRYSLIKRLCVISAFFVILFLFKQGSTSGRSLILSVTSNIVVDNVYFGVGWGGFKSTYGLYQAMYFKSHGIFADGSYWAGNSLVAYNEFLELIAETGMVGVALLCILFWVLYNFFNDKKPSKLYNPFNQSLNIYIIGISILCFFSSPFRVADTANTIFIIFVLLQILGNNYSKTVFMLDSSKYLVFIKIFTAVCILYFSVYLVLIFKTQRPDHQSTVQSNSEQIVNRSAEYMLSNNSGYLQQKAVYYFNKADFEKADLYNEKCNQLLITYKGLIYRGDINSRLGNTSKAIELYETAVFMIPVKFESKRLLMEEYWLKKDTINTQKWAKIIINQKPKINSTDVTQIKERARELIKLIE
jgi:tetratricopeptide (TPR) repeat protein